MVGLSFECSGLWPFIHCGYLSSIAFPGQRSGLIEMEHPDRDIHRRQVLALLGAMLFTLLYWLSAGLLGELSPVVPWLSILFWCGVVGIMYWSWSGRSRHWHDPGMTLWHMLWVILFVTLTIVFSPSLRPVMMLAYLALLPFGVLGLGWRTFLSLCFVEICCYSLVTLVTGSGIGVLDERLEILMGMAFVMTVMAFGLVGREVVLLRSAYGRKNRELRAALARIEDLAVRDELTGLCNRRFFRDMLDRQRAAVARDSRPFVVALLDIDRFDDVRLRYGKLCADRVLSELGLLINSMLRETDLVCRYGDGVFAVLLSNANVLAGEQVLERVRARVESERFSIEQVLITVSVGVVQYQPNESGDVLINRADQLVAEAQRAGRNRVMGQGFGPG
jgi:diguanylate cyclase